MLNFRGLYHFANFTLVKGKYALPPKPEKLKLAAFLKKYENISQSTLYKLEKEKQQQIQDKFNKYKQSIIQWGQQYQIRRAPNRQTKFLGLYCEEKKIPYDLKQSGELLKNIPKADQERYEKIYQSQVEQVQKHSKYLEAEYALPPLNKLTAFNLYVAQYGMNNKEKPFKSLTKEEIQKLNQQAEEINRQNQQRIQQVANKYNLSVEEFIKEVKEQKKLAKEQNQSESSSESSSDQEEGNKKQKQQIKQDKQSDEVKQDIQVKQEVKQVKQEVQDSKKETKEPQETQKQEEKKEEKPKKERKPKEQKQKN